MNSRNISLAGLTLAGALLSSGCGADEEAPLTDGLHLKYRWSVVGSVVSVDIRVNKVDEDHFLLNIEAEKDGEAEQTALQVDRFFKTEKGELASFAGQPLWLPASRRKKGVAVVADGSITMRKERAWDRWNVWAAGGGAVLGTVEWYYERDTGFLVGSRAESMGSGMHLKLMETNAPGL